jgi:hypothetical protein
VSAQRGRPQPRRGCPKCKRAIAANTIPQHLRAGCPGSHDPRPTSKETERHLRDLVANVRGAVEALDEMMRPPMRDASPEARGKRFAAIANGLEMAADLAERFGLGVTNLKKAAQDAAGKGT